MVKKGYTPEQIIKRILSQHEVNCEAEMVITILFNSKTLCKKYYLLSCMAYLSPVLKLISPNFPKNLYKSSPSEYLIREK